MRRAAVFLSALLFAGSALAASSSFIGRTGSGGGAGNPGGTAGQVQFNSGGTAFGGFTVGGDCTLDTSTGLATCLSLNGTAPGTLFPVTPGTGFTVSSNQLVATVVEDDCTSGTCSGQAAGVIPSTDQNKRILLGAHNYTMSTAGTAGFTSGWAPASILCTAGPCVITTTTSTFAPASATSTLTLQTGDEAALASDGTNFPSSVIHTVSPATPLATGTSVSLTAPRQYYVCTGTCTVTPPVPAAGYEFCVMNDDNVATVITLAALGSSARYENTARTAYGTAGTGTFVSGGAVGDKVCLLGRDTTHYLTVSSNGTWTAN